MKIRVCCPGEKLIEVPNDSKEPLADACRLTNYQYYYAIDDYTKTITKCSCIKCIDKCRQINDKARQDECYWQCRCGPCSNPFTGDC